MQLRNNSVPGEYELTAGEHAAIVFLKNKKEIQIKE